MISLLLLGSPRPTLAQKQRADDRLVAAIDKVVEKSGIHAHEPGVAIFIYQPGKISFKKGYGLANVKTEKPITPRTLFELASVSKTFTATAVLILHDRGKLSIDDEIAKYLPEMKTYRKGGPIHIRNLLNHTSGLPEYFDIEDVPARHKSYWVNDDYVDVFGKRHNQLQQKIGTGEKHVYTNTNFMLLASVVERVSKKPFSKFMRDEIFDPVGMEHTFVYQHPKVPENPPGYINAVGYQWKKKKEMWEATWGAPPARNETMLVVGDGSIWTNLEDMAKWDAAIREHKLLKPETWKMALAPSKTNDGKVFGYGLGWAPYYDKPKDIYGYGHDGSWGGFETSYYRYLPPDRTTVILTNKGDFDTNKLWDALNAAVEKYLEKGS